MFSCRLLSLYRETMQVRNVAIAFLIGAAALLSGCGKAKKPNVILVTIDTLRADHLSCYGYERKTSPFIDRIAEMGTLFVNASATSSWTPPSMASIFTGLYPRTHGVRHGFFTGKGEVIDQEVLSDEIRTLPEMLKEAGYRTFGVSSNGHLAVETGFAQGFDFFAMEWFVHAGAVNRLASEQKNNITGEKPYFLWIHYFDPHGPFDAQKPWIDRYCPDKGAIDKLSGITAKKLRNRINDFKENPDLINTVTDIYDSEINFCDEHIRRLFKIIPGARDSLVIITSDHGEEFLEHGSIGHGQTLYEETVRVPLIIKPPSSEGSPAAFRALLKTVDMPVSNLDIVPTVLDLLGLDSGQGKLKERSLVPLMRGKAPSASKPFFMELDLTDSWKAVRRGNWKLIDAKRKQDRYFLFDLKEDPGEHQDLFQERPELYKELGSELNRWIKEHPLFSPPKVNQAISSNRVNKLRSLGYLK